MKTLPITGTEKIWGIVALIMFGMLFSLVSLIGFEDINRGMAMVGVVLVLCTLSIFILSDIREWSNA